MQSMWSKQRRKREEAVVQKGSRFLCAVLLIASVKVHAGVEVSGFVDVLGKVLQAEDGEWSTSFQVGAYEVDLASELSDR